MTVAQGGCIFIQGGMSVELTDDGCEVWVLQPQPYPIRSTVSARQALTPDDMEELAAELVRYARVHRGKIGSQP